MNNSTKIYAFHGTGSRYANAVFSSVTVATQWITRHKLTGLLTAYYVDDPGYDRKKRAGNLPKFKQGNDESSIIQWYVDGGEHVHYFLGIQEGTPEFEDAAEAWDRAQEHAEDS